MIARIEGILRACDGNRVVLEVGGIGLELLVPARVAGSLGPPGTAARLHTHLHVREDSLSLYGFPDEDEKALFERLITVAGVGPKLALSVLSVMSASELAGAIHEGDSRKLQAIPGIGKKTAERIVLELKDKIEIERYLPSPTEKSGIGRELFEEAVTALESIGLSRAKAVAALEKVDAGRLGEKFGVEHLVRAALRNV